MPSSQQEGTNLIMAVRTVLVACALFLGILIIASGTPSETSRAFCKIVWLLGVPCHQANMAIVTAIKGKQSFKLGSVTPAQILANHTSAAGQVENLNFTLEPTTMTAGCHVEGTSVSPFWFSLFDNGTNYCNLYKVMKATGLPKTPGFIEFTNEWLCLGFEGPVCK